MKTEILPSHILARWPMATKSHGSSKIYVPWEETSLEERAVGAQAFSIRGPDGKFRNYIELRDQK